MNTVGLAGDTALLYACDNGQVEFAETLIEAGATVVGALWLIWFSAWLACFFCLGSLRLVQFKQFYKFVIITITTLIKAKKASQLQ